MRLQDILCIISGYVETLLAVGLVLGWPSMQYVLQREGYFSYLCINQTETTWNSSRQNATSPLTCNESEASFNLIFTIAVSSGYAYQILLGYLYDRFGTWKFRSFIASVYTIASILLVFATPERSYLWYPALMLLELAGSGLLTSNIQMANFSKPLRGMIIALMNGLISSSVVVFFSVKKAYDAGIDLQHIFLVFPAISAFLWIRTFALMPSTHIPTKYIDSTFEYGYKEWKCCAKPKISKHLIQRSFFVVGASSQVIQQVMKFQEKNQNKSISLKACLKNVLFWTNLLHFSAVSFRLSFVFGILQPWLETFADSGSISKLIDDLVITQICSVFAAPIIGIIYDTVAKQFRKTTDDEQLVSLKASIVSLSIISLCSVTLSLMMIFINPYGTFILVVFCRSFSLGGAITFISANFPTEHVGKLSGLTFFAYGVLALLQYPLLQIAFAFDPTFYYIHIGLLVLSILTFGHPFLIYLSIKKLITPPEYPFIIKGLKESLQAMSRPVLGFDLS